MIASIPSASCALNHLDHLDAARRPRDVLPAVPRFDAVGRGPLAQQTSALALRLV
jgi:hypothetical protein